MFGRLVCLLVLLLSFLPPLAAQRPSPVDAGVVRSELAGVLLQSGKYDDAAREYRVILAREPRNFQARLGLARALAWGKRPREAEYELRMLQGMRRGDRDVEVLLRSVRESLEPRSAEAAAWLAEQPNHPPYRLALARALVREGKASAAVPHYERLLAYDMSRPLVVEAAAAHTIAKQYDRSAWLLERALERYPNDAELLLERAQLHAARRDYATAETDALASLRAKQSVRGYLLLGDLRRWRGDYADARVAYGYARVLGPVDPAVHLAAVQLLRDERPVMAYVPTYHPGAGWHGRSAVLNDNLGMNYTTIGARRAIALGLGMIADIEVEGRRLYEENANFAGYDAGLAIVGGLAREFTHRTFLARLTGRGGIVQHENDAQFTGGIGAAAWFGAWGAALEYATAPAYASLLTLASVPLTETTVSAALGGPLGKTDIALRAQRASLSDDNQRSDVQLAARYPLTSHFAAIGAWSGIWFAQPSPLYWDPSSYVAAAAGLELSTRKTRGFSFAARVLGGPARSVEEDVTSTSLQLSGGADLSYRTRTQEVGAAINYGSGRAGGYRRFEASLYVSLLND